MSLMGHVLVFSVLILIIIALLFGFIMITYSEQKRERRGFVYNLMNEKGVSFLFHVLIWVIVVVMQGVLIFYFLE